MNKETTSRALERDFFLLALLAATAVGFFIFTRKIAAKEQQMELRIAAISYRKGQTLIASGAIEQAIASFRKAVANARENREYAFDLANALAAADQGKEAEQTVLRLRELDPENAEINLVLARLTAKRGDVGETVHYFENAIYGLWNGTQVDERRRQVRIELIHFLLAHQQRDRALSELLILEGDLPETPEPHAESGELFLQAGDAQRALKNFIEAMKLGAKDAAVLGGAGKACFQLGDYAKAVHYLQASLSQGQSEDVQQLLSLVRMILSKDPLAPHLTLRARHDRLVADYQQALQRLQNCLSQSLESQTPDLGGLENEAIAIRSRLTVQELSREPELARSVVNLIYRMEKASSAKCREAGPEDKALFLIASKYEGRS